MARFIAVGYKSKLVLEWQLLEPDRLDVREIRITSLFVVEFTESAIEELERMSCVL